jgi:hypothetical protein
MTAIDELYRPIWNSGAVSILVVVLLTALLAYCVYSILHAIVDLNATRECFKP